MIGPAPELRAGRLQNPASDGQNQSGLLGHANEQIWHHQPARRMLPAQECLCADNGQVRVELGLEVELELTLLQGDAHVIFQLRLFERCLRQLVVKYAQGVAPGCLGLVQGEVHALEQLVRGVLRFAEHSDADAGCFPTTVLADFENLTKRDEQRLPENPGGIGCCLRGIAKVVGDDRKVIRAKARCKCRAPGAFSDPCRDLLEQSVPGVMAERIVDCLEIIEVDVEQCAKALRFQR